MAAELPESRSETHLCDDMKSDCVPVAAEVADFMTHLVIMDETWRHHYRHQTKQQSRVPQWFNTCV